MNFISGCPWAIDPQYEDMFDHGSLLRRRYRFKEGSEKWKKSRSRRTTGEDGGRSRKRAKLDTPNVTVTAFDSAHMVQKTDDTRIIEASDLSLKEEENSNSSVVSASDLPAMTSFPSVSNFSTAFPTYGAMYPVPYTTANAMQKVAHTAPSQISATKDDEMENRFHKSSPKTSLYSGERVLPTSFFTSMYPALGSYYSPLSDPLTNSCSQGSGLSSNPFLNSCGSVPSFYQSFQGDSSTGMQNLYS